MQISRIAVLALPLYWFMGWLPSIDFTPPPTSGTLPAGTIRLLSERSLYAPADPVFDTLLQYGCTTGRINFERYTNNGNGQDLVNLYADPNYPVMPAEYGFLTEFNGPVSYGDQYGTRVRGYFVPPVSDDYLFTITGDDEIRFKMSRSADPSGARFPDLSIATWTNEFDYTKEGNQNSGPLSLVAGERYYVELLMKEGTGGDHFKVFYRNTTVTTRTIIPGTLLMPYYCESGAPTYCNKGQTVDVLGTDLNGYTGTSLAIPNTTDISSIDVVATYSGNYGGDSLVVTDDGGNPHTLHYLPKLTDSLFVYRGTLPATASITLGTTVNPYAARTLAANVNRINQPAPYSAATQRYVVATGYQSTVALTLPVPTDNRGPRDVTLTIPIVSRDDACGQLDILATGGDASATLTTYGGSAALELVTLTIPQVAADVNSIDLQITSPTGTNTGCPPVAAQDGHAFTVAGLVTVQLDCGCGPICLPVEVTRS